MRKPSDGQLHASWVARMFHTLPSDNDELVTMFIVISSSPANWR